MILERQGLQHLPPTYQCIACNNLYEVITEISLLYHLVVLVAVAVHVVHIGFLAVVDPSPSAPPLAPQLVRRLRGLEYC